MHIGYLLPDRRRLRVECIEIDEQVGQISLTVHCRTKCARCPRCGRRSGRVHSRYLRHVADLPWSSFAIVLHVRVRRFRCENATCPQQIFTERLPNIAASWSRQTKRLAEVQGPIGLMVGSSAGTRVCRLLHMSISIGSLLRRMRRYEVVQAPTPRVLGVDDWAKRRGHSYGTLLVDLETHCPVEVLPDREAGTLARWLQEHPGVKIISRDRAGAYAEGASQGAPAAIQVADRWHLLKSLNDALIRGLEHHHRQLKTLPTTALQAIPAPMAVIPSEASISVAIPPSVTPERNSKGSLRELCRAARYDRYTEVREAFQRDLTISAIARQTGLDRKTVRKFIQTSEFPERAPRGSTRRGSILDPFKAYLSQRWVEGCRTGRRLWRELRTMGYSGGYTLVNDYLRHLRQSQGIPPRTRFPIGIAAFDEAACPMTPRFLARLIVARPDKLTEDQRHLLDRAGQLHPDIQAAIQFGCAFAALIRDRTPSALDPWLEQVAQGQVSSLRGFARGLRRDYSAVKAALELPFNNGQLEGQVLRLKFLKRQGYGRTDFDLLRLRVLFRGQFG